MKKESFVLDTSLFVNPDSSRNFGSNPTKAFTRFLEQARRLDGVDFFMPPNIYRELMYFAEEKKVPKKLLLIIHKKPPRKHEIKVPGIFLYRLVETMRDRIDRGLRLSERHVREALQVEPGGKDDHPKGQKVRPDAELVGRLRESYRRIMREGMLDSRADVDLLLLAYELSGTLVSADQGVLEWAERRGIKILHHDQLPSFLTEKSSL